MKVTFDTLNEVEVDEVRALLLTGIKVEAEVAVKQTETVVEDTKEEKTTQSKAKPKKEPEEPKKAPVKKSTPKKEEVKSLITLADLKESAKNAVTRSSREDVKKTIAEFAEKLAEVTEVDYGKLYKKLQELGA